MNTKSFDQRLMETASFIGSKNQEAGMHIYEWGRDAPLHEIRRFGEKLHIGSSGTKQDRQYRRAIMLMRAAVLRHEINKVVSEVKAVPSGNLSSRFAITLQLTANHVSVAPTAIDLMAAQKGAKVQVEQAQRLKSKLKDLQETRKGLAHEIYLPDNDEKDGAIQHTLRYVKTNLVADLYRKPIEPGQSVAAVNDGGEIFVIGHGNMGTGIGTHSNNLGARELADKLVKDGLALNPTATVTIYLFSCWGATHCRRAFGGFGKREPYARRFARALAKKGFNNIQVVGFAGSVSKGNLTQDYIHKPDVKNNFGDCLGSDGLYSVYKVANNDFNRIAGQDWTTKPVPNMNTIAFWKGWCNVTVRKRGGNFNTMG